MLNKSGARGYMYKGRHHVKVVSSDNKLVWLLVDGYKTEYMELFEGETAPPNDTEFRTRNDLINRLEGRR